MVPRRHVRFWLTVVLGAGMALLPHAISAQSHGHSQSYRSQRSYSHAAPLTHAAPRTSHPRADAPRPSYHAPRSRVHAYHVPRSSRVPKLRTYHPRPRVYAAPGTRAHRSRLRRSAAAKDRFMRQTGHPHGWPGHVIDHRIPLACGGADAASNMQWQTAGEARAKDRIERRPRKQLTITLPA